MSVGTCTIYDNNGSVVRLLNGMTETACISLKNSTVNATSYTWVPATSNMSWLAIAVAGAIGVAGIYYVYKRKK